MFVPRAVNHSGSNIYLIGPMGSGKTTIGRRLAKLLNMEFLDCDHELEKQTGASISLIFDLEGEDGFRKRETKMLKTLTSRRNILLATGGGAVLEKENRKLLSKTGLAVYLQTPVSLQLHRLRQDRTRPLLRVNDRQQKLTALAEKRNPIYEELADLVFSSSKCGPKITAQHLLESILTYRKQSVVQDIPGARNSPSNETG